MQRQATDRFHHLGYRLSDVVQLAGEHPHLVARLVNLDTRAVELVLERSLAFLPAQVRQRLPHIVGGLREHRLQRAEQLDTKAGEARRPPGEGSVRHATQIGREHRRPADGPGLEPRRPCDRFRHEPFERPLPQLAHDQVEQEFLLLGRPTREQLAQEPFLGLGRALTGGTREALERRVDSGELEGRSLGRVRGFCGLQRGVADPDPPLTR